MSQIGKLLLWLALAGAVLAVIAGFGVIHQRGEDAQVMQADKVTISTDRTNLVKANQATAAKQGIAWCGARLGRAPAFHYRLNGLDLEPVLESSNKSGS